MKKTITIAAVILAFGAFAGTDALKEFRRGGPRTIALAKVEELPIPTEEKIREDLRADAEAFADECVSGLEIVKTNDSCRIKVDDVKWVLRTVKYLDRLSMMAGACLVQKYYVELEDGIADKRQLGHGLCLIKKRCLAAAKTLIANRRSRRDLLLKTLGYSGMKSFLDDVARNFAVERREESK